MIPLMLLLSPSLANNKMIVIQSTCFHDPPKGTTYIVQVFQLYLIFKAFYQMRISFQHITILHLFRGNKFQMSNVALSINSSAPVCPSPSPPKGNPYFPEPPL